MECHDKKSTPAAESRRQQLWSCASDATTEACWCSSTAAASRASRSSVPQASAVLAKVDLATCPASTRRFVGQRTLKPGFLPLSGGAEVASEPGSESSAG